MVPALKARDHGWWRPDQLGEGGLAEIETHPQTDDLPGYPLRERQAVTGGAILPIGVIGLSHSLDDGGTERAIWVARHG